MKIVQLIQGTREWLAHRAAHWNASDAPAMLGVSPYKTRDQLLRELATGITADVDAATQRRFDDGHQFEALARPLAEKIVGEDLFPCVGVDGRFSASFDGLTIDDSTAFEHKTLGENLRSLMDRAEFTGADLPEQYRVQMEHQCMVSGAGRVLFMATRWEGESLAEQLWCWYTPDPELRARIVAGWHQFAADLAAYKPEPIEPPKPVAAPIAGFGVLALRVEGRVLASNLDAFKAGADAFLARLPRPAELQTDQDFVDADAAVKACADAEDDIKAAKKQAIAQMADVEAVLNMADTVAESIRAARLALEKAVKSEKENRRADMVRAGVDAVRAHYVEINTTMGEHAIGIPPSLNFDIGNAIKGLKTLSSIREKINTAVAGAKIDASERAERVRKNVAALAQFAEHGHLFADRVTLCATKAPDDLRNLASMRVAEHKRREEERARIRQQEEADAAERLREQIRKEEEAKVRAEFERGQAVLREEEEKIRAADAERLAVDNRIAREYDAEMDRKQAAELEPASAAPASATTGGGKFIYTPLRPAPRLKLGDINAAIAPLSITADGLARLGFHPAATDKSAKLYEAATFEQIRGALLKVLTSARAEASTAAAA